MSGLDFLDLVLQSSDRFILNAVFQLCFSLFFSLYKVHVQLMLLWCCGFLGLFSLPRLEVFCFFWSQIFKRFLGGSHVFGRLFFFELFVGNYGALILRLPVLALSESVTMSGPARTLLKFNMSRIHFLVLVLQVSNSFDLISLFFQVLFSLILSVYRGHVHLLLAESLCSTIFFRGRVSVFFFSLQASTGFPVKTLFFGKSFFLHFYCNDHTLHLCHRALEPCNEY